MRLAEPFGRRAWRPRLLPAVIAVAGVLLVVKAEALLTGGGPRGGEGLLAAQASEPPPPAALPAAAPPGAAPPAAAGSGPASAQPPAQSAFGPRVFLPLAVTPPPPDPEGVAERGLLESLRARRLELDQREAAIAAREAVLTVAEQRLDARIAALAERQRQLEAVEQTRDTREDGAWRSLVKTYESMRPASAAAILQGLEMPVLVEIMDRMGERRTAPILAAMQAEKARLLTSELARHRTPRPLQ